MKSRTIRIVPIALLFASAVAVAQTCRTFIWHSPLHPVRMTSDLRKFVARDRTLVLAERLSKSDLLVVTELAEEPTPNSELMFTRNGTAVARFRLDKLRVRGFDTEWGSWAHVMHVVHLCSGDNNLTYVVLQAGSSGGNVLAFNESSGKYQLSDLGDASLGRLVVSVNDPRTITVWAGDSENGAMCTGCPKHYFVTSWQFNGEKFAVTSKFRTRKRYPPFEDAALLVKH